jgi:hypothetical protein
MSALTRTIVTCDCGIACGWKGGDVTLLLPTEGPATIALGPPSFGSVEAQLRLAGWGDVFTSGDGARRKTWCPACLKACSLRD